MRAGPGRVARLAGLPVSELDAGASASSGTQSLTWYRRPLTSASTSRSTRPCPSWAGEGCDVAAAAAAPAALPTSLASTTPASAGGAAAASLGGEGRCGASTRERSRLSSTHRVEWREAAKSGWVRIARWAGMFVTTPSISVSSSARIIRRRAAPRSGPQVTSLATRLS